MQIISKRLMLAGATLAMAVTAPLAAQMGTKPGALDPAKVTGGAYKVDNEHTMVRWQVDHLGITPYFGILGQITGSLTLDPKNPAAAKVDVTIPLAKVTTASPGLTAHMLKAPAKPGDKPDFFGPNPAAARFVSTAVAVDAGDKTKARITGNLTFNGVTKPVVLQAKFYGAGKTGAEMGNMDMVGFEAETTIKRSEFGMGMGVPMVSDEVELDIVAAFVK